MEVSYTPMSNKKQELFSHQSKKVSTGWDNAITEAERQIAEAEKRIATLKGSIQTFEEMRVAGESFPSEKPKRNSRKAKP
jgi:hypothetical protein